MIGRQVLQRLEDAETRLQLSAVNAVLSGFGDVVRRHSVAVSSRSLRRIYPAHPKSDPELYAPHGLRRIPRLLNSPEIVEANLARRTETVHIQPHEARGSHGQAGRAATGVVPV
ncbi:hypothetical protein Nm8I071_36290 [Nonomuraea sp. TT08I-71]|nr:hypothetical protein Nm8I071_36290 [Nonomuraea sp. TT08I-71]